MKDLLCECGYIHDFWIDGEEEPISEYGCRNFRPKSKEK